MKNKDYMFETGIVEIHSGIHELFICSNRIDDKHIEDYLIILRNFEENIKLVTKLLKYYYEDSKVLRNEVTNEND